MKRQIVLAAVAFASLSLAGCAGHQVTATAPYQEPGSASIRDLQLRLRDAGYDPGPADGVWGAGTHDALARYQANHGFPITGEPDQRTVVALGLDPQRYAQVGYPPSPPAPAYAPPPATIYPPTAKVSDVETRDIQRRLHQLGYYHGPLDGVLGHRTRIAIAEFQHDHRLRVSGEPTRGTLRALNLREEPQMSGSSVPPYGAADRLNQWELERIERGERL
jgi:peptidoglycan hydrolase-like protein with peptidoglycan-binding domain